MRNGSKPVANHFNVAALLAATACVLLAALLAAAPASAACPNEVFRSGPSAKLPDCRAYELVTPAYTGGLKPQATNFSNMFHAFDFNLVTDTGDSVIFNTVGGALTGTPGNGWADRYRARRTATGWVSELAGPTGAETSRLVPGPASQDHEWSFFNAGLNDLTLEPHSTLQTPFGGKAVDYLRKPNGESELIGIGSLGSTPIAEGRMIAPHGERFLFTSPSHLEPEASPEGMTTVYERVPGGSTKVLSLLPGDVTPSKGYVGYVGTSADANDVAFRTGFEFNDQANQRFFVRHNSTVTKEFGRDLGVQVGDEVTCESFSPNPTYQWLRDGAPIGGATDASYTTTAADAGTVLQCQVQATTDGTSFRTSLPPHYVAPFTGTDPPWVEGQTTEIRTATPGFVEVGETATCLSERWEGASLAYAFQWLNEGVEISGATSSTYTALPSDEGDSLQCRVTVSNADGTAVSYSSATPVFPPIPLVLEEKAPAISNVTDAESAPEVGDQLSCDPGTWTSSPSFSYQWLRDATPIGGATSSTYTVTAADESAPLQCLVTASTSGGTAQAISSNQPVVDPQPGEGEEAPQVEWRPGEIYGELEVGEQVFCSEGQILNAESLSFQWLRDGAEIAGANEQSYTVAAADLGHMVQCRVIGTNANGSTMGTYAGIGAGPRYVTRNVPNAHAEVPVGGLTFAGIRGGHVFYSDRASNFQAEQTPADLFSFDIEAGSTTRITDVGDVMFSHVSNDGSHVYFVSPSEIGGEGNAGEPNLYVWNRADDSTTYITTVLPEDVVLRRGSSNEKGANLASWTFAMGADKESHLGTGNSDTRSTPDGSVFLFQTTAQLTSFDPVEATPEDCGREEDSGDRCTQIYRYETATEDLTCVSCPPQGDGPATGAAEFYEWGRITDLNPPNNLSADGNTVVFESREDLLPPDGNERKDIYRWKKGEGLALISTGQDTSPSHLYAVSPTANDIIFLTSEKLVPEDENGGTARLYDARVNGGFPPDEELVTEPCTGDVCQGTPPAPPEPPATPNSSLQGNGNVAKKLRCPKGKRKVVRKGKERCIKRKGKKRRHNSAGKKAGAKRGANR